MATKHRSLPRGRAPWDPAIGLRVGTLAGGLLGAIVLALSGLSSSWVVAACGAAGGGIGYWSEKRKQRPPPDPMT